MRPMVLVTGSSKDSDSTDASTNESSVLSLAWNSLDSDSSTGMTVPLATIPTSVSTIPSLPRTTFPNRSSMEILVEEVTGSSKSSKMSSASISAFSTSSSIGVNAWTKSIGSTSNVSSTASSFLMNSGSVSKTSRGSISSSISTVSSTFSVIGSTANSSLSLNIVLSDVGVM